MPHVPPKRGLILCLEHHVVEDTPGGKRSRAIPDWSAAKIRRVGADAAKVLVWQRHDASAENLAKKLPRPTRRADSLQAAVAYPESA